MASSLAGKVALITGASSGIGAATALLFAKRGARLALTGRDEAKLSNVAEECSKQPDACKPFLVLGDMTNEGDVKQIIDKTINHYDKLDILVNNAGAIAYGNIETTSLEQYDHVVNVNVRSVYHVTMLAVPHLIKTKGNIVNVSSLSGIRAFPQILAYCMSKAALDQFTRCVALDLASKQVRVNSVNPGVIETSLQKKGGMDEEAYAQYMARSKEIHPIGRVGTPEEVAAAIAFLASEEASNITGTLLPCDGGRHVSCPR